ncbi:MAG: hypothetical protein KDA60_17170 [Planctomycetales bacterium]|nr:hypothetical protein [Planctomycetales bacterium]
MIADASRFREMDEFDTNEFVAPARRQDAHRELSGRAKFARQARHSRGGGKAKLFNGAHLRRTNRHVSW